MWIIPKAVARTCECGRGWSSGGSPCPLTQINPAQAVCGRIVGIPFVLRRRGIGPGDTDLGAMARLRDAAQNAILGRCGEPSLIAHAEHGPQREPEKEQHFAGTAS
ncbi:hypothetical protein [Paraburkholderia aromaticivorans]|uniref:hypothetical protein n=1 Tax=Paraburkholderia aromaticivorans TaxID=2026199 RepID=UPI0012FDE592|nr:hypothetical protein [Paraburkholderia aromaticivorans]